MVVWQIDPAKKEIRERVIPEGHPAEQGVEQWVIVSPAPWWLRWKEETTKKVIQVLVASDPQLFTVPLEEAFIQMLAKSLMSPPRPPVRFSFLSVLIGVAVGAVGTFLILHGR